MKNITKRLKESSIPSGCGFSPLRKAQSKAIYLLFLGIIQFPTLAFSQYATASSARDNGGSYNYQHQNQGMQKYNNIINQNNAERAAVNDAAQAIGQALNSYNQAKRDNDTSDDSSSTVDTSTTDTPPADNPHLIDFSQPQPPFPKNDPRFIDFSSHNTDRPAVSDAPPPEKYSGFFDSQGSGSPSQPNQDSGAPTAGGAMAQPANYADYFAPGDSGSPNQDFVPSKDLSQNSLPGIDPFKYQMPQATKDKIHEWVNNGGHIPELGSPSEEYCPINDDSIPSAIRDKILQLVLQQQQEQSQGGGPTLGTKLGNVWNNVKQQVNNVFDPLGSVVNDNQGATAP